MARGDVSSPPRSTIYVPGMKGSIRIMPAAIAPINTVGVKVSTVYQGFWDKTQNRHVLLLYSTKDGSLLSIISADRFSQIRTGAASGVATKYLARRTPIPLD